MGVLTRFRFERLYQRQHRRVFALAWRLSGFNITDAEDLTQETFLRALKAYARYSPRDREFAWLRTICINIIRERWRRSQILSDHLELDIQSICSSGWSPVPDAAAITAQRMERVLAAMNRMRPEYRQVLILKYLSGLTDEEIAEIQQTEPATVRSRIRRARGHLTTLVLDRKE
ncbi:MAG TPA: sigma-70 family RNA polymerase sigma factor [bacterium]|nr:sigma-70 family RNA polymerase sigma factor [bacterium]